MGEQAIVADALEAVGQDVKQEAPQEFEDVKAGLLPLAVVLVVLVAEVDAIGLDPVGSVFRGKRSWPPAASFFNPSRNLPCSSRLRTLTWTKKSSREEIQRSPSGESPPPGTMQCRCT